MTVILCLLNIVMKHLALHFYGFVFTSFIAVWYGYDILQAQEFESVNLKLKPGSFPQQHWDRSVCNRLCIHTWLSILSIEQRNALWKRGHMISLLLSYCQKGNSSREALSLLPASEEVYLCIYGCAIAGDWSSSITLQGSDFNLKG